MPAPSQPLLPRKDINRVPDSKYRLVEGSDATLPEPHRSASQDAVASQRRYCTRSRLIAAGAASLVIAMAVAVALVVVGRPASAPGQDAKVRQAAENACSVFCDGSILHAVQSAGVFPNDSKTFVDMPLAVSPAVARSNFHKLGDNPSRAVLKEYVAQHFAPAGSDIDSWEPPDWQPKPSALRNISDKGVREWALQVHALWKDLGRQVRVQDQERHSLLQTPHPYIVPGGRFRENYYWDSYWIVRGLLVCGMTETATNMVNNLLYFVRVFGFVPNGGRVYYLTRSQPPLLADMVAAVHAATGDDRFLRDSLPILVKEYRYWTARTGNETDHTVVIKRGGNVHHLSRYSANTTSPRPESYREDVDLATGGKCKGAGPGGAGALYREVAAGAETGWDFSSRWFEDFSDMCTIRTRAICPVDLNVFMSRFESHLGNLHAAAGKHAEAKTYAAAAANRTASMLSLMYNATTATWNDIRLDGEQIVGNPTLASFLPLWLIDRPPAETMRATAAGLNASALVLPGGVSTSGRATGQQWDFPNAWAPLQHMLFEGLMLVGSAEATALARKISCRWIITMRLAFKSTGAPPRAFLRLLQFLRAPTAIVVPPGPCRRMCWKLLVDAAHAFCCG